jgi:hypothetical protein
MDNKHTGIKIKATRYHNEQLRLAKHSFSFKLGKPKMRGEDIKDEIQEDSIPQHPIIPFPEEEHQNVPPVPLVQYSTSKEVPELIKTETKKISTKMDWISKELEFLSAYKTKKSHSRKKR